MTAPLTAQQAIAAVMAEVGPVAKTDRNAAQNFNFRGIDAVVNALSPVMKKHGVVPVPVLKSVQYNNIKVNNKDAREILVVVRYRFYGPDGSYVQAVVPAEAIDYGDKGTAKAMSVAYRIALLQTFALPTTEADPDAQSYERSAAAAPVMSETEQVNTLKRLILQVGAKLDMKLPDLAKLYAEGSPGRKLQEGTVQELKDFGKHLEGLVREREESAAMDRAKANVSAAFPETDDERMAREHAEAVTAE